MKRGMIMGALTGVLVFAATIFAEDITLTTYYPAPYGEYEQLYVSGNLGIGTTAPIAKLDIASGDDSNGLNGSDIALGYYDGSGYRHWIRTKHNASTDAGNTIEFYTNTGDTSGASSAPETGNVLGLAIDNGSVGIGTTAPRGALEIQTIVPLKGSNQARLYLTSLCPEHDNAELSWIFQSTYKGYGSGVINPLLLTEARLNDDAHFDLDNEEEAMFKFYYYLGTHFEICGEAVPDDQQACPVFLYFKPDGGGKSDNDRWYFMATDNYDKSGNFYLCGGRTGGNIFRASGETGFVGIGNAAADPEATLDVAIGGTTLADAWSPRSSIRWKENIQPISNALDKVTRLRGVYFDWKQTKKHDLGLIAEEVGKVIPELVTYEDNGIDAKSLDYDRLAAVLVEAVKEQQKEIEEMRRQIEELKHKD